MIVKCKHLLCLNMLGFLANKNEFILSTIENNGIGYLIEISLNTYTQIKDLAEVKLLIHYVVREDAHLLFGFFLIYHGILLNQRMRNSVFLRFRIKMSSRFLNK